MNYVSVERSPSFQKKVIITGQVPPEPQDTLHFKPLENPEDEGVAVLVDTVEELGSSASRMLGTCVVNDEMWHLEIVADNTEPGLDTTHGFAHHIRQTSS